MNPWQAQRSQSVKAPTKSSDTATAQPKLPATGTVVLDVEQGGIEVPSFVGKTVRGAVEAAQDAGLELEAVGSGVARQQISIRWDARGRGGACDGAVR